MVGLQLPGALRQAPPGLLGNSCLPPLPRVPLGSTQITSCPANARDWQSALQERLGIFTDLSPRECGGIQCEAGLTQPGLKGRSALAACPDRLRCGPVFLHPGGSGRPLQAGEMGQHAGWGPGALTDVATLSLASPVFGNSPEKTELSSGCFQGPTCSLQGDRAPRGGPSLLPGPTLAALGPEAWLPWSLPASSQNSLLCLPPTGVDLRPT